MTRKPGTMCDRMNQMIRLRIGTRARINQERPTSSRSAMNTPPTIMIGAVTSIVNVMRTSIWT